MAEFSVTTGRDGARSFGEHDDRDRWSRGGPSRSRGRGYRGNNRRYNSSRSYSGGGGYRGNSRGGSYRGRGRGGSPDPRSRLDDEGDDTMGDGECKPRFNPYGRPQKGGYQGNKRYDNRTDNRYSQQSSGGSSHSNTSAMKRLGVPFEKKSGGDSEWFKILIPWGKKADKDFILKSINAEIDTPFLPTWFHFEEKSAVFYINDRYAADAIRGISRRITMPNGYKMTILVKNSHPPNIPLGDEELGKLKVVMSNRYDPATKALNLSSLQADTDLMSENLYLPLARNQVMTNVVSIIKQNIPELVSLDMSNNKLVNLEHLGTLVQHTPDIKILNLGNNKLTHLEEVRKVKSWKIDWLTLEGNPLCDKFNDQSSYISGVRKLYPKVMKLDSKELPPPITFDIEARTDLPKTKDSYFPSVEIQGPLVKFLKDYFMVYDSDNRAGLSGAYHDSAMFSLAVSYNAAAQYKQKSLSGYLDQSRNFVRANSKDTGRKHKLLRKGNQIIPQLCLLPKTVHDPNSFLVDCTLATARMVTFTVQGVFKEVDSKLDKPPIRTFSRTFVTVPGGTGMLIVNDVLTISNASQDQMQSAFKNPAPTPSSSPVPQTTPSSPFDRDSAALTDVQKQMITSFRAESGMNADWSGKCLAENGWQYAQAGQNFLQLKAQGKIPAEAFV